MEYIKQILVVFSVGLILFTMYQQNQRITVLKDTVVNLEKQNDSLRIDLFEYQTMNGRYELGLEHLKEINAGCAKELQNFMESELE